MYYHNYSSSEVFFSCSEPLSEPGTADFNSLRGRWIALKNFFIRLGIVPLALLYKLCKTLVSFLGVGCSIILLLLTLCSSQGSREFFIRKISCLAKELADWILWPVGVVFCLVRLLLASIFHPAIYFHS